MLPQPVSVAPSQPWVRRLYCWYHTSISFVRVTLLLTVPLCKFIVVVINSQVNPRHVTVPVNLSCVVLSLNVNVPISTFTTLLVQPFARIFAGIPDISTKEYPCNCTEVVKHVIPNPLEYLRVRLYPLFVFSPWFHLVLLSGLCSMYAIAYRAPRPMILGWATLLAHLRDYHILVLPLASRYSTSLITIGIKRAIYFHSFLWNYMTWVILIFSFLLNFTGFLFFWGVKIAKLLSL